MTAGERATRGPTFRLRLTLTISLLSFLVLAIASTVIYLAARQILRHNLDNALLAIARTEVASAIDGPGGRVHVHEEGRAPIQLEVADDYVKLAMIKRADAVLARTANLADEPLRTDPDREAAALAGKPSFGSTHRGGEVFRVVYYPLHGPSGEPLVAVVALPMQPIRHSLYSLLEVLLAVLVGGSAAAALGASRIARHLTRPLERIAEAAHAIDESDPAARIPATSPDAELREVTAILNDLLARMQAALQSQRRFVADASHELRSPLANLRGTVEVALRQPRSSEDYRTTLEEALAEIERLCRLVEAMLALTRADAQRIDLQPTPCDLARLAQAAARAHAARADAAGVAIECQAESAVPATCDMDRLRAALDNLLDNAVRHAPRGSTVSVRVRRRDGLGIVEIQDRGPGLERADLERVFERFYRADAARARHSGGLGLGLTIARSIVEAHGGTIRAESEPGQGATFIVELPLR